VNLSDNTITTMVFPTYSRDSIGKRVYRGYANLAGIRIAEVEKETEFDCQIALAYAIRRWRWEQSHGTPQPVGDDNRYFYTVKPFDDFVIASATLTLWRRDESGEMERLIKDVGRDRDMYKIAERWSEHYRKKEEIA